MKARMARLKRGPNKIGSGWAAKRAARRKGRRKKHSKSGYTM